MPAQPVTAETSGDVVTLEVRIDARPETVFPYFTDPEKMIAWMGTSARLDARTGGVYRVDVTPGASAEGEYVEVDPPRRVVFSWGWRAGTGHPVGPGESTVEVDLIPDGGGTIVRLRHKGLPDDEQRELHADGWNHFLPRLQIAAGGGDPGPDPWAAGGDER